MSSLTFGSHFFSSGVPDSSFILLQDSFETSAETAFVNLLALSSQLVGSKTLFITFKNNQLHYFYLLKKMV